MDFIVVGGDNNEYYNIWSGGFGGYLQITGKTTADMIGIAFITCSSVLELHVAVLNGSSIYHENIKNSDGSVVRAWVQLVNERARVLAGVTRDSSGNPLGSATVILYRTVDYAYIASGTSDGTTGAYTFSGLPDASTTYFVVGFKSGSPDTMGVTDNNLVAA